MRARFSLVVALLAVAIGASSAAPAPTAPVDVARASSGHGLVTTTTLATFSLGRIEPSDQYAERGGDRRGDDSRVLWLAVLAAALLIALGTWARAIAGRRPVARSQRFVRPSGRSPPSLRLSLAI